MVNRVVIGQVPVNFPKTVGAVGISAVIVAKSDVGAATAIVAVAVV